MKTDQKNSFRYWKSKMVHVHTFVSFPEGHKPFPEKITATYVFSPDIGHYLCSQVKNYWFTVVGVDPVWPEGVEPSEEHAEMWEDVSRSISPENDYFVASSIVRDWREGLPVESIVFTKVVIESEYLGEFTDQKGDCGAQAALECAK
tara:strand:+ start:133 stop:573 length:441 start_codon:yes stop_codon:yes gene_type:complete